MGSLLRVRPSSSLSRRLRHVARKIVRSGPWRDRTKVMVWTVFLVAIVLEGVLVMQPSASGQNTRDLHSAIRAAPTTKAPAPTTEARVPTTEARVSTTKAHVPTTKAHVPATKAHVPATNSPVPTVLPSPSPATTLVPASAAEQAAFRAGQRSCQTSPAGILEQAGSAEQAAFTAGYQWCRSAAAVGHDGSGTKP